MAKPEMNRAKIVARLLADGWDLYRHGAEHDLYRHPTKTGVAHVPRHRTLTIGVARDIARTAGW